MSANPLILKCGQVAEWSIAPVLKTGERASVPGVRIPPCPPPCPSRNPGTGLEPSEAADCQRKALPVKVRAAGRRLETLRLVTFARGDGDGAGAFVALGPGRIGRWPVGTFRLRGAWRRPTGRSGQPRYSAATWRSIPAPEGRSYIPWLRSLRWLRTSSEGSTLAYLACMSHRLMAWLAWARSKQPSSTTVTR